MGSVAFSLNSRAAHSAKNAPCEISYSHSPVRSFVAHSDVPSSQRPEDGEDEASMKSLPTTGNCRTSSDPTNVHRTKLHKALVLHVSDPAKVVAQKIEASHRTVESHRQRVPDSWAALIAYCRAYPAFALDVLELMNIDIDADREAYAMFLQLQKQVRGES